jgi:phosphatidylinositol-bisphosphatase
LSNVKELTLYKQQQQQFQKKIMDQDIICNNGTEFSVTTRESPSPTVNNSIQAATEASPASSLYSFQPTMDDETFTNSKGMREEQSQTGVCSDTESMELKGAEEEEEQVLAQEEAREIIHLNYVEPSAYSRFSFASADQISESRNKWIQNQMQKKAHMYTENRTLKIAIGSWNVNSTVPNVEYYFDDWLHLEEKPDIIAVGLQEIDMSAQAMIKNETEQCEIWSNLLDSEVQKAKNKYCRLISKQMVGLFLSIYIKEKFWNKVKNFKCESLGLGAMGRMGNKGGIGARFQIYETTFCFITSHLAPHAENTAKRNQHFNEIFTRLDFGGLCLPDNHDYLFWFGDLNYRIEHDIEAVRRYVSNNDIKSLIKYDQLIIEKLSGRAFFGFREGNINFLPTYKYDPGTLTFDTSEKNRTPSFCDRILWKGKKRDKVKQMNYDRYELLGSDHLPVSSLFQTEISVIVDYKYKAFMDKLVSEYDKTKQNDILPDIDLSTSKLDFGQVMYDTPSVLLLTIRNIGEVIAEFNFVPTLFQDDISKPWLKINPESGTLMPGESLEIQLTICIDSSTGAYELNTDLEGSNGTIFEILVLHVKDGRDYFVRVNAEFQKSFFGNSLENLVKCHKPIRLMQRQAAAEQLNEQIHEPVQQRQQVNLLIPKELWRLTDYIFKYGMRESGLFQETGDVGEVAQIREIIDNGWSLEEFTGSIHSVSDTLISFLESLKDSIIPTKYYKKCMENYMSASKIRNEVICKLPSVHFNVFEYLMAFLRELLLNSDVNNLTADQLAEGFSNLVLRSPANMPEEMKELYRKHKIVLIKNFLKDEKRYYKVPAQKIFKDV